MVPAVVPVAAVEALVAVAEVAVVVPPVVKRVVPRSSL